VAFIQGLLRTGILKSHPHKEVHGNGHSNGNGAPANTQSAEKAAEAVAGD